MGTPHPAWVRPDKGEFLAIVGGCFANPVTEVDVTVDNGGLDNPTLNVTMACAKYRSGGVAVSVPFPLIDAVDTTKEATSLAMEVAEVAVSGLCKNCLFGRK